MDDYRNIKPKKAVLVGNGYVDIIVCVCVEVTVTLATICIPSFHCFSVCLASCTIKSMCQLSLSYYRPMFNLLNLFGRVCTAANCSWLFYVCTEISVCITASRSWKQLINFLFLLVYLCYPDFVLANNTCWLGQLQWMNSRDDTNKLCA